MTDSRLAVGKQTEKKQINKRNGARPALKKNHRVAQGWLNRAIDSPQRCLGACPEKRHVLISLIRQTLEISLNMEGFSNFRGDD